MGDNSDGDATVSVLIQAAIAIRTASERLLRIRGIARCVQWLREGRAALAPDDRRIVDALLTGTGCEQLFVA